MEKKNKTKSQREPKKVKKKNIKKRVNMDPAKLPNNAKIVLLIALIVLLVLCFINLGLIFTIITAFMVLVIIGIAKILDAAQKNRRKRKIINALLIIILTLGILGLVFFAAFLVYVTVKAPEFDVRELNKKESTIIYDKDGKQIIKLGLEMRDKVEYQELPQVLVDAVIATEDARFYQHSGFDLARFMKASFGQVLGHSDAGGASTLSMQVIKNTFTSTEASGINGIIRKFTDIYLAVFKLEKTYSKEEIIEFYVNNHFLGGNIYGVQEASLAYFGKDVSDLNLTEAATLAGMFKSPNAFRPTTNPENATKRRNTVLYLMNKHGYITDEEYKLAKSIPIDSLTADESSADTSIYQGYIDTVVEEIEQVYGVNAYTTPLLIYTNMDREKQDGVNRVLSGEAYDWINDKVQTGVSVLDTGTGKILAIGAGRNRSGANTYNYATQLNRQPGSTAKPLFDYGPGIEFNDWSTYNLFDDAPYSYSNGQSIKNWDGGFYGTITLRRALSTSRNIPALKAFQQVDKQKIIDFVTGLGISPEIYSCRDGYKLQKNKCINNNNPDDVIEAVANSTLHEAHSIGAFTGVSPLEMSAAYAAFSNGGTYHEPYSVSKIVYRDSGKTVEHKDNSRQVMSDATAFMISSVLQDVALNGGTPHNVAAKTGTTNYDSYTMEVNNMPWDAVRDSWVIGYTTKTIIGMWYGYDYIDKTGEYVLHNVPATIQKDRLFIALANNVFERNRAEFSMPSSVVKVGVITGSNPPQLAGNGYSGDITYEYFKKGHEPEEVTVSKLSTPKGLKVSANGTKVTVSWNAVKKLDKDENYGEFGYNVYQGSKLLTFTSSTSYTFDSKSPYGTYKVIATYKSYSGVQSDAASYTFSETTKLSDFTCPNANGTLTVTSGDPLPNINTCTYCTIKYKGGPLSTPVTLDTSNCGTGGVFKAVTTDTSCKVNFFTTYNNVKATCQKEYIIKPKETTSTNPTTPTNPTNPGTSSGTQNP